MKGTQGRFLVVFLGTGMLTCYVHLVRADEDEKDSVAGV
jgi:hypothetical protein